MPARNLVGEVGNGLPLIFELMDGERIALGAEGAASPRAPSTSRCATQTSGASSAGPMVDFQAVGHRLADMAVEVDAARLLVVARRWRQEQGLPCSMEASMAKIAGTRAATRCAERGMQILGGYSYMVEYGMERYYREAKLTEIVGGTNEIQRNIVLKHLRSQLP